MRNGKGGGVGVLAQRRQNGKGGGKAGVLAQRGQNSARAEEPRLEGSGVEDGWVGGDCGVRKAGWKGLVWKEAGAE
eukprot:362778-Chlamydomonas_euryale.AAC.1